MKTLLYITDLYYEAKGRNYYEEDLYIISKLKDHFNILIGHPHQVNSYLHTADLLVFRNTGSILNYELYFREFVEEVRRKKIITFNSFDGKADIKGKQYLIDLTNEGFPVIPTIENVTEIDRIGNHEKYVVKIKNGADSIGMDFLSKDELLNIKPEGKLIQPFMDFDYEVSFYYMNDTFQYALYAPDKKNRWQLIEYKPSAEDLKFGDQFIKWNNIDRGITRVDACRVGAELLLVELEDLNPFLSIDLLSETTRDNFINALINALNAEVQTAQNIKYQH